MSNELLWCAYDNWIDSKEYRQQSALENGIYDRLKEDAIKAIGEKAYRDISDYFMNVACEAERAGFEFGFRSAFKFIRSMLSENEEKARAAV